LSIDHSKQRFSRWDLTNKAERERMSPEFGGDLYMERKDKPNLIEIKDWQGETCYMSPEEYEIIKDDPALGKSSDYKIGLHVRKISGVDGSPVPGHHFNPNYVTVCRSDAETAQFIGVKRDAIKPI
jgi:hypothetical protein